MRARLDVDGRVHEVALKAPTAPAGAWTVDVDGESIAVTAAPGGLVVGGRFVAIERRGDDLLLDGALVPWRILDADFGAAAAGGAGGPAKVRPPMNGKVERILVETGQTVERGQVLFVLEAMKMQNEVRAPAAGRVGAIHAKAGAIVEPSQVVLELEAP